MFRLRILNRDGSVIRTSPSMPSFEGIRTEDKLKTFLMSDLLSYYTYLRLSDNYFTNKSEQDEKKHLNDIIKTSKMLSMAYANYPSGTPADQLAKRVENLIRCIRNESPKYSESAVTINPENIQFYHDFFDTSSKGPQLAVNIDLEGSQCVEKIRKENDYEGGQPGHIAMSDMVRWLISNVLEKSRFDMSLQSILKIQHDTVIKLFPERTDIPENIRFDLMRMYLALSCIMYGKLDSIGDVHEPVMTYDSFKVILPTFKVPPITDNLVIMGSIGSEDLITKLDLSNVFKNVITCVGSVDSWDQEMMLYKARLSLGYKPYNLLVIDDGHDGEWSEMLIRSVQNMRWIPKHAAFVSDLLMSFLIPFPTSIVRVNDHDDDAVCEDIQNMYTIGIRSNDRFAEAIIRTTFTDILSSPYPGLSHEVQSIPPRSNSITLFKAIQTYISENSIDSAYENYELAQSLIRFIRGI